MRHGKYVDPFGNETWFKDGNCHREDGPARISSDGTIMWYKDGQLHREDGPAIIFPEGEVRWYLNDTLLLTRESWLKRLSDEAKLKALFSGDFL
jgi:hypothetical protein